MLILFSTIILVVIGVLAYLNTKPFGRLPQGKRLERILHSPNFKDGEFRNQTNTPMFVQNKGMLTIMYETFFKKNKDVRPSKPIEVVKTDLNNLPLKEDLIVWFGHSSYLIQSSSKKILVDPVFITSSPAFFINNRPFEGTNIYTPEDMPDIDYLVITHDHWDHLDYETVIRLKNRIGKVICPLGVGEYFEYWGFNPKRIIELDWNENVVFADSIKFHCMPARHFSRRGLKRNRTLWASFILETPTKTIFIGGDGGYAPHFADIGKKFPNIDLAVLENGQYNEAWANIHLMPKYMVSALKDLNPRKILTVHHSKFALAQHPWYEPIENELMMKKESLPILMPKIGEVVTLDK